jgi:hypothetical protein
MQPDDKVCTATPLALPAPSAPSLDTLLGRIDPAEHAMRHAMAVDFSTSGLPGTFRRADGLSWLIEQGLASEWPRPVPVKIPEPAPQGSPRPTFRIVGGPRVDPVPGASGWDEPIYAPRPSAVPFPTHVLPSPLADLVLETAASLPCAPDLVAAPALAVVGGAIGRAMEIAVKESWKESAALYLAVCDVPGSSKSEALRIAAEPITREHARDLFDYAVQREVAKETQRLRDAERRAKGVPAGSEPDEELPPLRRVRVGDTTTEKLAVILSQNPRGVTMIHDELTAWIGAMNQYKGGSGADRQFYLSVWSGASISIDRKSQTDGIPIHIPHPFLAIVGNATPEKLTDLNPGGKDDGFLDRILFAFPDEVKVRFSTRTVSRALRERWNDAVGRLYQLPLAEDGQGGHCPAIVRFSRPALERYAAWYNAHCEETEALDFPRHLKGPWAKLRGYCARIALSLEAIHWAYDASPTAVPEPPVAIDTETVERAIALVDYFKAHTARAYQVILGKSVENPDAQDVLGWAVRRGRPSFLLKEARDCFKRRIAANPTFLDDALRWLMTAGCIRRPPASPSGTQGGRPTASTYEISPYLLKGARGAPENRSDLT